jgi:hypothetical protein
MIRSLLVVLSLIALLAPPLVGLAPALATSGGERGAAGADLPDGDERVTPAAVVGRPVKASGMWTSRRPAEGGAYRWRIMAVGIGVLGLTSVLLVRFIRRQQPAVPRG